MEMKVKIFQVVCHVNFGEKHTLKYNVTDVTKVQSSQMLYCGLMLAM